MTIEPLGGSGVSVSGARALARLAKSAELALAGADLSLPQYRVLIFLADHDAAAASALASRLDVTRPTITALVDGLVARGLVERRGATGDRRRVEHHLTRSGERALDDADRAVAARLDTIAGHLDDADAGTATAALDRWAEGLERLRAAYLLEAGHPADASAPVRTSGAASGTGGGRP